jgi:hypothetical protein
LASWPDWLVAQLSPSTETARGPIRVPDRHSLMRLVRLVANAAPGERNNLTFWAGCRAGKMVAHGRLEPEVAVAIIAEAAVRAGLPRPEAERTAWSGVRTTGGNAADV